MKYAHIDSLINYFVTLPTAESINLIELEENIFKNCTQNFLNGNQKLLMTSLIERLKTNLQIWDEEWLGKLSDLTLNEYRKEYLEEQRKNLTSFRAFYDDQRDVIKFLNEKPRKQWIIQGRRYSEELSNTFNSQNDDDTEESD